MTAIGPARSHAPATSGVSAEARSPDARHDEDTPGQGGLHRLLNRTSPLDRLVGDAGALGKFLTDAPDRMPSGTSALTLKVGDALNRLAARLGLPSERILSGNPSMLPQPIALPPAELPAGSQRVQHGISPNALGSVDAAAADNRAGHIDRGNRHEPEA